MGQALLRSARRLPEISVVSAIEQAGHPAVGSDAGEVAGIGKLGVNIAADIETVAAADVLVDFALNDAVAAHVGLAVRLRRAMVIGTTGLKEEETAALHKASASIPVVWAPNMSLGVNLLFAMVKKAASVLGNGYRVEIEETHHVHKKDAPSGTALHLGRRVAEGLGADFESIKLFSPDNTQVSSDGRILMRSHRIGEVIGDHTVSFENEGERLEFTHHAVNREAFAMGALRAALWVERRKPGLYDMQDVLGL